MKMQLHIRSRSSFFCFLFIFLFLKLATTTKYKPDWKSLDSRPLPTWYDESKVGIFIHWGVFSVPAYGSAWFWYFWKGSKVKAYIDFMAKNYRPDFTYADFAPNFKAEFYQPEKWAEIFKASGAKYVVLVTKHHEGFTSWPSKYSWNWNAMDVGPHRDLVGELATAVRKKTNIRFGVYHSLFEWFNPLYKKDAANNYRTQYFVKGKTVPELYELVNRYKPDVVWSDGQWEASDVYWDSKQFLTWLYNDSPVKDTVVVNDRWGNNTACKHGGFWNCKDKFTPGKLMPRKWEHCTTIDKHAWTFRANANIEDFQTIENLLGQLVTTVSLGGNILINVGPTSYGTIAPIFEERLRQLGSWLSVNGEAIYKTKPWTFQNDSVTPDLWYTSRKTSNNTIVYAITLKWPKSNTLTLGHPVVTSSTRVSLVGLSGQLNYKPVPGGGMVITVPRLSFNQMPCQWSWVFKLENLKNQNAEFDPSHFSTHFRSFDFEKALPQT